MNEWCAEIYLNCEQWNVVPRALVVDEWGDILQNGLID